MREPVPPHFYEDTDVRASWMLGGLRFRKGGLAFDFNFTFTRNASDPFRGISLLAVHDRENMIREIEIHDHITIITEGDIEGTQDAQFKANSDFGSVLIPLRIIGRGDDDGTIAAGAIVAIVIGCVLVALGGGYFVYRWNLKRKQKIGKELEESLIDRDTLNQPQKDSDEDEDSEEDDEEDDEDEDEE